MALPDDAADRGWRRVRALRARCGLPGAEQAEAARGSTAARDADAPLPEISGGYPVAPLLGLGAGQGVAALSGAWLDALGWVGVPLASAGVLAWGRDLKPGDVTVPTRAGDSLLLPPPDRLRACTGIELKPLRQLVAERVGYRLQAGPGVHLFAWEAMAILVSCRALPLGGLLAGPRTGSRATVALEAGGTQVVRW